VQTIACHGLFNEPPNELPLFQGRQWANRGGGRVDNRCGELSEGKTVWGQATAKSDIDEAAADGFDSAVRRGDPKSSTDVLQPATAGNVITKTGQQTRSFAGSRGT
jgi:hypothetical protein